MYKKRCTNSAESRTMEVQRRIQRADPGQGECCTDRSVATPGRLYSSHLEKWRTQRQRGELGGKKRGRKSDPQASETARLQTAAVSALPTGIPTILTSGASSTVFGVSARHDSGLLISGILKRCEGEAPFQPGHFAAQDSPFPLTSGDIQCFDLYAGWEELSFR
jgi:hypothetical protein